MAKALDVARYLIQLAASQDEPDYLSHLRLQKLLYYVQGWSLALREKPIFDERIEAWAHGPVVKDVYPVFASYSNEPIPATKEGASAISDEEECALISAVWNAYKGFSALALRAKTHAEKPWIDARKGCGPTDRCEVEITQAAMQEYFKARAAA